MATTSNFIGVDLSSSLGLNSLGFIIETDVADRLHRVACRQCAAVVYTVSSEMLQAGRAMVMELQDLILMRCREHSHFCPAHDAHRFMGVIPHPRVQAFNAGSPIVTEALDAITLERIYAEGDVHFVCILCRETVFKLPYRLAKDFTRKQVMDLVGEAGADHALKCKRLHQNKTVAPNPKAIRVVRMGKGE